MKFDRDAPEREKVSVLLVDDNPDFLEQMKLFLEREDERLDLDTSTSAEKALKMLEEGDYDAVVSDYKMLGMSGLEFLKTLRDRGNDIPFIIFTGRGREEVAMEALNLGADRYLLKGDDPMLQCKLLADAIVHEIERKRAEEAMVFERNLLRSLLDYTPDMIWFMDREVRYVATNRSHAEYLGVSPEDMIGKTDLDFYPEEIAKKWIEHEKHIMETEEPMIDKEEKIKSPATGEERWVSTTKIPRYDENGNVIGTLGISRDITARKRAEEREEFLHSLLRHDVRNKAQIVLGYLELLREDLPEEHLGLLERAMKATRDEVGLIEKVRFMRRLREEGAIEVGVDAAIESAIDKNESFASERGIKIDWKRCRIKVLGGPLLDDMFSNLIENAIRHSGGTKVRVSARERDSECTITVEDDGRGIPADMMENIFEMGFRGEESTGTGMGLHLVKGTATRYGGSVEVKDSKLGGARFDVHLKKA